LLSVALSLGSLPAGVTRRLAAVEPGLSSTPEGAATVRPSGASFLRASLIEVNAGF
jgi:hypothetical protein